MYQNINYAIQQNTLFSLQTTWLSSNESEVIYAKMEGDLCPPEKLHGLTFKVIKNGQWTLFIIIKLFTKYVSICIIHVQHIHLSKYLEIICSNISRQN